MINNIRKLREEQGLTLKRLSELTGLAPSLISQYEKGIRHPKIENWQKLADYFGVSIEYLQGKTLIKKDKRRRKQQWTI